MTTRLAICGLGQGMHHIEACLENDSIRIVALVDKCEKAQTRGWTTIGSKYPDILQTSYKSVRDLAADKRIKRSLDGVILALPHHVYIEEWSYIMSLGVPILKEKPLGRDLFEANQFLNDAQNRGIALITAVQRRYHPAYRALRKSISEQQMVRSMRIIYCLGLNKPPDPEEWRQDLQKSGGAMLLDAGYHMMDLVQFLVGTGHLVSATLTKHVNGREIPCGRRDLEENCYLTVGKDSMLISIECHLFGKKTERVLVDVVDVEDKIDVIELDRGVPKFTLKIPSCEAQTFNGDWKPALERQLKEFVEHIRKGSLDVQRVAYSQLPVQRIIHDAYALADPFSSGIQHLQEMKGEREDNDQR